MLRRKTASGNPGIGLLALVPVGMAGVLSFANASWYVIDRKGYVRR